MLTIKVLKEIAREIICATLALVIFSVPANIFPILEGIILPYEKWTLVTVKSLILFGFTLGINGWLVKYIINTYKEEINENQ